MNEEIDRLIQLLIDSRRLNGASDGTIVAELNARGIRLEFMPEGVRWHSKPVDWIREADENERW